MPQMKWIYAYQPLYRFGNWWAYLCTPMFFHRNCRWRVRWNLAATGTWNAGPHCWIWHKNSPCDPRTIGRGQELVGYLSSTIDPMIFGNSPTFENVPCGEIFCITVCSVGFNVHKNNCLKGLWRALALEPQENSVLSGGKTECTGSQ